MRMGEAIAFYVISACILGFGVLVISTKDTVHSVLFLVLDFLFVAALYVLLGAQFLAAIQVLVYAGDRRPVPVRGDAGQSQAAAGGAFRSAPADEAWVRSLSGGADRARRHRGARVRAAGGRGGRTGDSRVARRRKHRTGRLAVVHQLPDSVRNRIDAAA